MASAIPGRRAVSALGWAHTLARLAIRLLGGERGVRATLAAVPRPASPVAEPWELSFATLLCRHPRVPSFAGRLLRRFDKYGQVVIGPERVGFDRKTVRWSKVIEIRTYPTTNLVPSVVVDREIDRIREALPPVPGRRWIVTRMAEGLLTLLMAILGPRWKANIAPRLPCEIVYRNVFGRQTRLRAGLFAVLVLAAIPESATSLVATAQASSISIRPVADGEGATTRAARADHVRQWFARVPTV